MEENLVLEVKGICKKFAGVIALDDVGFSLRKGEIHALIGANGAGKSTLIKILTGAYTSDSGTIILNNKEVSINSPTNAKELGISAVYQEFSLINQLTVAENIYLGKLPTKDYKMIKKVDWEEVYKQAQEVLNLMDTHIDLHERVGNLSVAQKQLVEIAKALSNNSSILIMDEPTASLTDNDIDNMLKIIRGLSSKGISIVYVSHRLEELPLICDRLSVFRDGRYITTLDIEDAPKNVIIEHMVGRCVLVNKRPTVCSDEIVLEVKGFSSNHKFQDIDFQLRKGEILGFAGLTGAGRTELMRAIFGVDPRNNGEVFLNCQHVDIRSPGDAIKLGIGFITEDRKEEGLILGQKIHNNVGITILKKLTEMFRLNTKKEIGITEEYIKSLAIKTYGPEQKAKDLSGGNQQKVVIAKWLVTEPTILIMDEPTRGIDVGSKNQIYELMDDLAKRGISIIMVSSEIPEVLQVSDRIIVMAQGVITGEFENKDITQEQILGYAVSSTRLKCS